MFWIRFILSITISSVYYSSYLYVLSLVIVIINMLFLPSMYITNITMSTVVINMKADSSADVNFKLLEICLWEDVLSSRADLLSGIGMRLYDSDDSDDGCASHSGIRINTIGAVPLTPCGDVSGPR